MAKFAWFLFFLAISASFLVTVKAQEEEEELVAEDVEDDFELDEDFGFEDEEEWDGTLAPSDEVETFAYFPDYPDNRLPINKEVTLLLGVSNTGSDLFNVSFVGAHLHSPYDLDYYIQNFSVFQKAEVLPPGVQYTIEYKFAAPEKLEPLEYWFSAFIILNGTDRMYQETPINGTITLYHEAGSFGFSDIVMYLISIGFLGAVAYFVLLNFAPKSKSYKVETGTREEKDSSWDLPERVPSKRRKNKKKTN